MASAWRYAAAVVFMIVVLASGILHGMHTSRWSEKPALDRYLTRLDAVPEAFGDWTSKTEMLQDDLRPHGIEKYIFRTYTYLNNRSTESYQVLVVCGRPGPIASHTPDVCYRGSGYTPAGDQKRADVTVTDETNRTSKTYPLFYMKFQPPKTRASDMEKDIRWAWMAPSKSLQAPDWPRIEFESQPALYKVYIIDDRASVPTQQQPVSSAMSPLPATKSGPQHDPKKFLEAFLPRLEAALKDPPAN
jgi:hypothetical protein